MERRDLVAAVAFALLTLPFHPHWLDFEMARRGLAMLVGAGILLALSVQVGRYPWPRGSLWLGAWIAWSAVRAVGAINPGEAWLHVAYLVAVFCAFVYGARRPPTALLRILAPTLTLVIAYGIAQSLGMEWPSGYAHTEAVSTLGNRNVASEFVAISAAGLLAWLIHSPRPPRAVPTITLVCAVVYLGLNGTRAGIFATGVAAIVAAYYGWSQSRRRAAIALGCALLLAVPAWTAAWTLGDAAASESGAAAKTQSSPGPATDDDLPRSQPSTIAVRKEIWTSGLGMIADAPIAGHGTGQFRYTYPRYRSAEEIELSTFGRKFSTFVATAHNDHLELWIDRGLIGFGLWCGFWITVLWSGRRRSDRTAKVWWLPCAVFLSIGCVRSPLSNAPAALLAFAFAGAALAPSAARMTSRIDREPTRRLPRWVAWPAALILTCAGLAIVFAQFRFAAGVQPIEGLGRATIDRSALDAAISFHRSEPRLHSARIRAIRSAAATPQQAFDQSRADVHAIRQLDPDNPAARYLIAELAHFAGEHGVAAIELDHVLKIDPRHIEATLLRASRFALVGQAGRAVQALYYDPSPRLRAALAVQLQQISDGIRTRDPKGAALLAGEARFVRAVDTLLDPATATGNDHFDPTKRPDEIRSDRLRVLYARRLLAMGDESAASALAPERALDMNTSVRRLVEPLLQDLAAALPSWRATIQAD